jgi:hypothetical protein
MKKLLFLSDMHVGHKDAICPPEWWGGGRKIKLGLAERWEWFDAEVRNSGPYDAVVLLGDMVAGANPRAINESICTTMEQQDAAVSIIERLEIPTIFAVYGTEFHVMSGSHELEKAIADRVGAEIHKQIWINIGKFTFDCRHHPAGNSSVYPGNPLQKEYEANVKWADEGGQARATHIVRGHVHRMFNCGVPNRWQAYACPALQDVGDRLGARLSSVIHFGFGYFEFNEGEWPIWKVKEMPRKMQPVFNL